MRRAVGDCTPPSMHGAVRELTRCVAADRLPRMSASKRPTVRKLAVYAAALLVFLLAKPVPDLYLAGCVLAVLGETLRVWACGHLRKNQAVIQSGPYAHVKNPLYLGTFLIMVGVITASTDPAAKSRFLVVLILPFMLGVFFFYYLPYKFAVEADRLRRRFGAEWDDYDQAVPDFVPRLTPHRRSGLPWSPQLVVENSEVSAALLVFVAMGLLGLRMADLVPVPW
jgi:protein-S-isoprenylcysteine O-methyltransferase Ste14